MAMKSFFSGVKTMLFEGERDHLIPSTSPDLIQSDFFIVAGRIMGHCFLNDGPCLHGLSEAIIHVLFGGLDETATIHPEDCVDQDVRDVVLLVCICVTFVMSKYLVPVLYFQQPWLVVNHTTYVLSSHNMISDFSIHGHVKMWFL